jgi:glucose-6-phosphate 1-dehydrogenase
MGSGECANNVIFYLSVSPELYVPITVGLAQAGLLAERTGWRRMVIEKPFGHDLQSARDLQHELNQAPERRADLPHRSLRRQGVRPEPAGLALCQHDSGTAVEPHYIDHVQITHAETIGVEWPGQLLRPAWRSDARHDPEPPAAGSRFAGNGATGIAGGRIPAR